MLYLKEHKKVALHVACGDITNAVIEGNKLVIRSSDEFVVDVLTGGRGEIENALRWQGLDLQFEVVKFDSAQQKEQRDIKKLENWFSGKLNVQ